jgi:RimJ/RimL family protein N-acetyltransferase
VADDPTSDAAVTGPPPERPLSARSWISTHEATWESGAAADFAVTDEIDGRLLGALGFLRIDWTAGTAGVG